jgi:hypothetical protein
VELYLFSAMPLCHGLGHLYLYLYHLAIVFTGILVVITLAGGQLGRDLEGNTTVGGKESEAASSM